VSAKKKKAARPNPRLVKIHRSYSVEEVADLLGKHKNTVRAWIKAGLPTCDGKRPTLILGRALREFLIAQRGKNKKPCSPGEIYCVRCRVPRKPAGEMAEYQATTTTLGDLIGICPVCDCVMHRRTSLSKIDRIRGNLDITFTRATQHIGESINPFVNCDFERQGEHHEITQPG
jgi:hypothetical protein